MAIYHLHNRRGHRIYETVGGGKVLLSLAHRQVRIRPQETGACRARPLTKVGFECGRVLAGCGSARTRKKHLIREFETSLPIELTLDQGIAVAHQLADRVAVEHARQFRERVAELTPEPKVPPAKALARWPARPKRLELALFRTDIGI